MRCSGRSSGGERGEAGRTCSTSIKEKGAGQSICTSTPASAPLRRHVCCVLFGVVWFV